MSPGAIVDLGDQFLGPVIKSREVFRSRVPGSAAEGGEILLEAYQLLRGLDPVVAANVGMLAYMWADDVTKAAIATFLNSWAARPPGSDGLPDDNGGGA